MIMGMEKSYVKPEEVLSPRSRVRGVVEVIHDPGADRMSVAQKKTATTRAVNQFTCMDTSGRYRAPFGTRFC